MKFFPHLIVQINQPATEKLRPLENTTDITKMNSHNRELIISKLYMY